MIKLNYEIIGVKQDEKEKLYKLLQYALYDGSQYIDNDINEDCIFEYRWFDNYFTDNDRNSYFIKSGNAAKIAISMPIKCVIALPGSLICFFFITNPSLEMNN